MPFYPIRVLDNVILLIDKAINAIWMPLDRKVWQTSNANSESLSFTKVEEDEEGHCEIRSCCFDFLYWHWLGENWSENADLFYNVDLPLFVSHIFCTV